MTAGRSENWLRWALWAVYLAALFAFPQAARAHDLPNQPYSVQLVHKIDHAKIRVSACTAALGWRQHRVLQQHYRRWASVVYREHVLAYWRSVARACERHVLPWTTDWQTAVDVVQRPFPGTSGWLLSCSGAESRWGSWVWNGGAPLRFVGELRGDRAGGYLQFRISTYVAHDGQAFTLARRRGFAVPVAASYWNALGQAVVGGYMRFTGRDAAHWSASWGRGC